MIYPRPANAAFGWSVPAFWTPVQERWCVVAGPGALMDIGESGRYRLVGRRGVSQAVGALDGFDEFVERGLDTSATVVEVIVDLEYPVAPLAGHAQLCDPVAVVEGAAAVLGSAWLSDRRSVMEPSLRIDSGGSALRLSRSARSVSDAMTWIT